MKFKLALLLLLAVSQFAMADETKTVAPSQEKVVVSAGEIDTAPATLFFFSQVNKAAAKKSEPQVLEFGESVNVNTGGSPGLPANSSAFSPY